MLKLRKSFTRRRSQQSNASDSTSNVHVSANGADNGDGNGNGNGSGGGKLNRKVVVEIGAHSIEGQSHANEDRFFAIDDLLNVADAPSTVSFVEAEAVGYAAVFDGHGGYACSDYLSRYLHRKVLENKKFEKFEEAEKAMEEAFKAAEDEFVEHAASAGDTSGSCAVAVLLCGTEVVVGHCGDCRLVMKCDKKVQDLTTDHRPGLPSEKARIKAAGGSIKGGRVQGVLAPSRSFGDLDVKLSCKNAVIAVPDVSRYQVEFSKSAPTFLVLASDGVFDAMSSEKALSVVAKAYSKSKSADESAKSLAEVAAGLNSDDVTVVVIVYSQHYV